MTITLLLIFVLITVGYNAYLFSMRRRKRIPSRQLVALQMILNMILVVWGVTYLFLG
ncbi:hypothetical protein NRIC_27960 [Enterococcus florum]|uniref:Immunity protein n=1 Tax=Enterococcus florum TaxID=2480627 RepID=A0A4P5P9X6_9ENTE|nr:hypothetical protein [Enterococcus florum]GCF94905.1 hypothetical protein NRIC_27960 [Enterococcus florum]